LLSQSCSHFLFLPTVEAARPVGNIPSDSSNRDWRYSLTLTWNFNNLL